MNNEYVKIGKEKYLVTDENGAIYRRTVSSPKIFEYENNIELADNKIKSLISKKNKISTNIKRKNLRNIFCYIPVISIWCAVFLRELIGSFSSSYAGIISKILMGGMFAATAIADAVVIGNTITSNIEAKMKKEDIDKSLVIARRLKKGYEYDLKNYKFKSIIGVKDNTKENKKVSLKERNDHKSLEINRMVLNYAYLENKDNSHVLVKRK